MTSPALVKGLGSRLPSADERAVADHLRTVLAAQAKDGSTFRVMVGSERKATEITLTPALSDLFVEVLRHIGRGEAVTLVPVGKMLTTQQAADILNVSRPFLVSLLENGEIAHERVGRHRRVRAEDLFAYKEARAQRREKALSDLAAMDAQTLWTVIADRFTAVVDACALAGALKRNLLLTLAEAEFFRLRWSVRILDETQAAIGKMLGEKGVADAFERAARARGMMETAFEEATVSGFEAFLPSCRNLPDLDDAHVVAAALRCDAAVIVTDNLRHFPANIIGPLGLDAVSTDAFLADTVSLDEERAVGAIKRMRLRLKRPEKTAKLLLDDMEATGLVATATILRAFGPML